MPQKLLFEDLEEDDGAEMRANRSGSFVDNMQLPVHRWFRYSAGFSACWVGEVIREASGQGGLRVLDPFAGSGTVVLEAERAGVEGVGIEAHPFIARIAKAKLLWRENAEAFRKLGIRIAHNATKESGSHDDYAPLIKKCYPPETLVRLDMLKKAIRKCDEGPLAELCWLTLVSILRAASPVGTAQWQYILPRKAKAKSVEPLEAFKGRIAVLAADMLAWQKHADSPRGQILCSDARTCDGVPDGWADLIVTSPPYANNYDYADATRLEMTFLGEINGWGDLQAAIRAHLVRSCTQHVSAFAGQTPELLKDKVLEPIRAELIATCERLEAEKENHGGKKQYHAMVAHYFYDLARVWQALRRATRRGGRACFVVGDSAPYGIHVPVDRWLGELAVAAGFKSFRFEKLRDRNTKWLNRKHRVPLHEGRLWVEG
jgi:DNA modification methylase